MLSKIRSWFTPKAFFIFFIGVHTMMKNLKLYIIWISWLLKSVSIVLLFLRIRASKLKQLKKKKINIRRKLSSYKGLALNPSLSKYWINLISNHSKFLDLIHNRKLIYSLIKLPLVINLVWLQNTLIHYLWYKLNKRSKFCWLKDKFSYHNLTLNRFYPEKTR